MAGGVTELIIFAIICTVLAVIGFFAKVFFIKDKGSADWMPGQHYEVKLPDPQTVATRKREKYIDPLANLNPMMVGASIAVFMLLVFAFYVITKGGLMMGN
jgi:hypothetical protein